MDYLAHPCFEIRDVFQFAEKVLSAKLDDQLRPNFGNPVFVDWKPKKEEVFSNAPIDKIEESAEEFVPGWGRAAGGLATTDELSIGEFGVSFVPLRHSLLL
jgi:hypothetical protein